MNKGKSVLGTKATEGQRSVATCDSIEILTANEAGLAIWANIHQWATAIVRNWLEYCDQADDQKSLVLKACETWIENPDKKGKDDKSIPPPWAGIAPILNRWDLKRMIQGDKAPAELQLDESAQAFIVNTTLKQIPLRSLLALIPGPRRKSQDGTFTRTLLGSVTKDGLRSSFKTSWMEMRLPPVEVVKSFKATKKKSEESPFRESPPPPAIGLWQQRARELAFYQERTRHSDSCAVQMSLLVHRRLTVQARHELERQAEAEREKELPRQQQEANQKRRQTEIQPFLDAERQLQEVSIHQRVAFRQAEEKRPYDEKRHREAIQAHVASIFERGWLTPDEVVEILAHLALKDALNDARRQRSVGQRFSSTHQPTERNDGKVPR